MRLQNSETMMCIEREWGGWKGKNEKGRNSKQAERETERMGNEEPRKANNAVLI